MARCLKHKDQNAITQCNQCHKPLCKSCTMVTPQGSFCSSECSILSREFKARFAAGKPRRASFAMKFIGVILFVFAIFLAVHGAHRFGNVEIAGKFDIIGRVLGYSKKPPERP